MEDIPKIEKSIIDNAFETFKDFKVLVVGDVMLDTYTWGKVQRISPEAPIPVLSYERQEDKLGGAANVVKNIQSLGATPVLCSVIGNDEKGKKILELFQRNKLNTQGILIDKSRKTTVKTRFLSGFHHLLRVDEEDTEYLTQESETIFYERILNLIENNVFHAVIFQDYDKGVITPKLIKKLKALAAKKQIPTVVDPKKRNFSLYKQTTLFKPNHKEFLEGTGYDIDKEDFPLLITKAQEYRTQQNIDILLLTLSAKGILVCYDNGCTHLPAKTQEIADVSGAGDTVIATATLCLIAKLPLALIGGIANIAGGLVCKHPVIVSVDKNELITEVYNLLKINKH